MIFISFLF